MRIVKDGWHKVYGYEVLTRDGIVLHATDGHKPLYPYRHSAWGGWVRIYKEDKLSLIALESGIRRGTITLI